MSVVRTVKLNKGIEGKELLDLAEKVEKLSTQEGICGPKLPTSTKMLRDIAPAGKVTEFEVHGTGWAQSMLAAALVGAGFGVSGTETKTEGPAKPKADKPKAAKPKVDKPKAAKPKAAKPKASGKKAPAQKGVIDLSTGKLIPTEPANA